MHDYGNLRELLSKDEISFDYIIKLFYDADNNILLLFAGSYRYFSSFLCRLIYNDAYSGAVYIYSIEETSLKLECQLPNSHTDIIRDILFLDHVCSSTNSNFIK